MSEVALSPGRPTRLGSTASLVAMLLSTPRTRKKVKVKGWVVLGYVAPPGIVHLALDPSPPKKIQVKG